MKLSSQDLLTSMVIPGNFATALVYTIWLHCCCCFCSLCLPAAANFYTVVSQDVVTVAIVYLKWLDACVGRDQHLCCLLSHRGISTYVLLLSAVAYPNTTVLYGLLYKDFF